MIRSLLTLTGMLALMGCANGPQLAEKTDTTALSLYATIGQNLDTFESAKCGAKTCDPSSEAMRLKAWNALGTVNTAYNSGVVADLAELKSLVAQSKAPS